MVHIVDLIVSRSRLLIRIWCIECLMDRLQIGRRVVGIGVNSTHSCPPSSVVH
jgi:hypothetical protein